MIARKIDSTLAQLLGKVDGALAPPSTAPKLGEVKVVRVNAYSASPNSAVDRSAEIAAVIEKVDTVFPDNVAPATLEDITEGEEALVRTKTPVEGARESGKITDWKCCSSSSSKKDTTHAVGCENKIIEALPLIKDENAAAVAREQALSRSSVNLGKGSRKIAKLLQEPWVCKGHKRSPPVEDTEFYLCMRCTRNRTNKTGAGRRP